MSTVGRGGENISLYNHQQWQDVFKRFSILIDDKMSNRALIFKDHLTFCTSVWTLKY